MDNIIKTVYMNIFCESEPHCGISDFPRVGAITVRALAAATGTF